MRGVLFTTTIYSVEKLRSTFTGLWDHRITEMFRGVMELLRCVGIELNCEEFDTVNIHKNEWNFTNRIFNITIKIQK